MVKLIYVYLSLQHMCERSGIMKKQLLKILRKQYLTLIENLSAFENLSVDEKVDFLNKTLLNIFRNYIPNKKIKCDYRQPPWVTDIIKKYLKQRCKLTKFFYKNGHRKVDHDKVLEKSKECNKQILEAKKTYIIKMTKKSCRF